MDRFDTALAESMGFDQEDLAANREGRLRIRQRNRVFSRQRAVIIALLLITIFIGVVSALVIIAVLSRADGSVVAGILAVIGEVITVVLAFYLWYLGQRYRRFLQSGYVEQVSGPVTCYQLKERQAEKSRTGYYIRIGAMEFEVSEAALSAFQDGQPYTLYFVPRHLTLLSAERVVE